MMKSKFAITAMVLLGLAAPALAQGDGQGEQISKHRADAIQQCQGYADSLYGPSGGRDWRRFDHDTYAACMFDRGEPQ